MTEGAAGEETPVLLEVEDGIATVALHRPGSRNAISRSLLSELRATMAEIGGRSDVAAVVLTGSDPAFCAGLDLRELSADTRLLESIGPAAAPWYPWAPLDKVVIGAINGPAVTGGLELALHCDFLIASERATFADTHARVGVLPGWGLSVLLPQRVGFAMARRMSLTGDFIDADRALQAGLVTEVVPHDQLLPTAVRLAATVAGNHRPAVTALQDSYRRIEMAGIAEGLHLEQEAFSAWRNGGHSAGIGERAPRVISRGRGQVDTRPPAGK